MRGLVICLVGVAVIAHLCAAFIDSFSGEYQRATFYIAIAIFNQINLYAVLRGLE